MFPMNLFNKQKTIAAAQLLNKADVTISWLSSFESHLFVVAERSRMSATESQSSTLLPEMLLEGWLHRSLYALELYHDQNRNSSELFQASEQGWGG